MVGGPTCRDNLEKVTPITKHCQFMSPKDNFAYIIIKI